MTSDSLMFALAVGLLKHDTIIWPFLTKKANRLQTVLQLTTAVYLETGDGEACVRVGESGGY